MRKKTCTRCKIEKSIRCFGKRKSRSKGLAKVRTVDQRNSHCRECQKEISRERRKSDTEKCDKACRETRLRKKYGITIEDYDRMFAEQSGRCKICDTTDPGHGRRHLAVDHNHETGEVRGLLCYQCNLGLGCFQDNKESLEKAILYLSSQPPTL
jgi:hypothetical protein